MADKPTNVAGDAHTQKQTASGEKDWKKANKPTDDNGYPEAKADDEPVYFDTTIAKLVKRENADGDEEWVEVMSDNLYPGEKLKRADDDEKAAEKDERARQAASDAKDRRDEDKK